MLMLAAFYLILTYIGYKRGRPVSYSEQASFVLGLFIACWIGIQTGLI